MDLSPPFLCCAAMTATSALVSLGFSLAAIRGAAGETRHLAYYASARSVALAIVSLTAFIAPPPWLEAAAASMIIVQAADARIGATIGSPVKTFGPAITAAFNAAALAWLLWH